MVKVVPLVSDATTEASVDGVKRILAESLLTVRVNEYLPLAFVTVVPTSVGPPTRLKSWIGCPDLQLARSDLSLPKIVITVPEWTLPRGVLWIVRCVVVTVVAASATPLDRTKEKQMKSSDAMIASGSCRSYQPHQRPRRPVSRYTVGGRQLR
jgi:hypothetical protein